MKPSNRVLRMYEGLGYEQLVHELNSTQNEITAIHEKRAILERALYLMQEHRTAIAMTMEQSGVLVQYMEEVKTGLPIED